ncbi:hypothetical protein FQR65_LT17942 [Abscondita terminalis]|nr:hypothetical protein FQR65_LT17942 [Abscondita terminalis]
MTWASGFEYYLMLADENLDRANNLNSIPVRPGTKMLCGCPNPACDLFYICVLPPLICMLLFYFWDWHFIGSVADLSAPDCESTDLSQVDEAFMTTNVSSLEKKPAKRTPSATFLRPPLLQQEPCRTAGPFRCQKMQVAQRLYEAGRITYMRTDSVNLSDTAIESLKKRLQMLMLTVEKELMISPGSYGVDRDDERILPGRASIRSTGYSLKMERANTRTCNSERILKQAKPSKLE